MMAAVTIRRDIEAGGLRRLALAAVLDGLSREQTARTGGMDRQTPRDWVHRFNAAGLACSRRRCFRNWRP
jgi:transposase